MALVQASVDHLDRLPDELVLEIIEQHCLCARDLISLARTSRRYYRITISPAYKAHVERENGFAIYWAIDNEQRGTLDRLVEQGVDVNMLEDDRVSFIVEDWISTRTRYTNACRVLEKLDLEAQVSPLAWAASLGRDSMVEYLLDHEADIEQKSRGLCNCSNELLHCPSDSLTAPEITGSGSADGNDWVYWTPLHYAICNRKASTAQLLLERGANARNVLDPDNHYDRVTALHVAVRSESHGITNYLLDKDLVDINTQDAEGVTVLHMAHAACEYELVDELLDKGADITLAYDGETGPWTVFSMACAEGLFGQALEYLRRGADPHFVVESRDGEDKFTVMRLIYRYAEESDLDSEELDQRMELEREIIAGGRPSSSNS